MRIVSSWGQRSQGLCLFLVLLGLSSTLQCARDAGQKRPSTRRWVLSDSGACAGRFCRDHPPWPRYALTTIWGRLPEQFWAAGHRGLLLHGDGARWQPHYVRPAVDFTSMWGSDDRHIWAVGEQGTIQRWDGAAWRSEPSGTTAHLNKIWGLHENAVWIVGAKGTLLAWNGARWEPQVSGTDNDLYDIWGASARELWAVGQRSTALYFKGVDWQRVPVNGPEINLTKVWGKFVKRVFAYGDSRYVAWDGTQWGNPNSDGEGGQDVDAELAESAWTLDRQQNPELSSKALDVARQRDRLGIPEEELQYVDPALRETKPRNPIPCDRAWPFVSLRPDLRAVWGAGEADSPIWAVGEAGTILRGDGVSWKHQFCDDQSPTLWAIWGSSAKDIWAVGPESFSLHWDGSAWTWQPSGTHHELRAIWGHSATDAWAVGSAGTIVHWDGVAWQTVDSPILLSLNAVWGRSPRSVWVAGNYGEIWHFNGAIWRRHASGAQYHLRGLWGLNDEQVWAVGGRALLRWDGAAWHPELAVAPVLNAVGGSDAAGVWAVGEEGTALFWDGARWTVQRTGVSESLNGIWTSRTLGLRVVGDGGVVLSRPPTSTWNAQ